MDVFSQIVDIFVHLDEYLGQLIDVFGIWTYVILFLIVFAETGFVVTPFLPGDSLLFTVGTLSGGGYLNVWVAYFLLLTAAILGDTINYWIGHYFGPKVFKLENSRVFNKKYLDKTHAFYEKHGGKTIIIARFVPIVRTFAPFVAGIGAMNYRTFLAYNIIGAFVWVTSLTFLGYYFGALEIVKRNFEYAIFIIIFISILPIIYEYTKHLLQKRGYIKKDEKVEKASIEDIEKTFKKDI